VSIARIFFLFIGAALAAVAAGSETAAGGGERYSFGVVPQQSASKLARTWTPVLEYLGGRAGIDLRFATAPDIPEFERRVAAGEYDFAYMNPYHYTVFSRAPGYRAFAKESDKLIRGILVVRTDSPLQTPTDLDGATIAFPAPAAFAASVLPRAFLTREGIAFTPRYVASHDSVYRTVAKGLYPAGGGVMRTLNSLDPAVREKLRVLWTTDGYTPHAFAAHPRIPQPAVAGLAEAMRAMSADPRGRALLEPLDITGFGAAVDGDWDDVRALEIDLLDDSATPPQ
jgi:phosphonate transport system substrate-binding protein